jgi:hypothetical protein
VHKLTTTRIIATVSISLIGLLFLGGAVFKGAKPEASADTLGVTPPDTATCIQVGEELEYAVSYSFFSVGTVRFKILGKGVRDGRPIFKALARIESNPSLSWLTEVHIRFYAEIDDSVFSHYWISEDSSKSGIDYHSLTFDYPDHHVIYQKGNIDPSGLNKIDELDTVAVTTPVEDGLSLFYYARERLRQAKQDTVLTFIDNVEKKAYIDFQNKIEDVEIDAVKYPIETVYFDGHADFVGVVGLTGGFRGWFSNDAARIPIMARLNVWIGSIKVELKSWNRPGWVPPRYTESR